MCYRNTEKRERPIGATVVTINSLEIDGSFEKKTRALAHVCDVMCLAERTDLCSCRDDTESENRTGTRGAVRRRRRRCRMTATATSYSLSHSLCLTGRSRTEHRFGLSFLSLSLSVALVHSLLIHTCPAERRSATTVAAVAAATVKCNTRRR